MIGTTRRMGNALIEHLIDTHPIFARGDTPRQAIDNATASLIPGQPLVLIVPFEPVPPYAKLGKQGFTHQAKHLAGGVPKSEVSGDAGEIRIQARHLRLLGLL